MKILIIFLLLGGIVGAGLMLWLGIKSAQKYNQDHTGDSHDS